MHSINTLFHTIHNRSFHMLYGMLLNCILACNQLPCLSFPTSKLQSIKEHSTENDKASPNLDRYLLHKAVRESHLEDVKAILAQGQLDINKRDKDGFTALHHAVDRDKNGQYTENQLKILKEILQHNIGP